MSVVLFSGYDANGNNALWVTDGTASGTHELAPIAGAYAGTAGIFPKFMTAFGGTALFAGEDAAGVMGLWITDGSAAGTHELSGIAGAHPTGLFGFGINPGFTVLSGKVLFEGVNAAQNVGLWVTDGTAAGTHQLTGISGALSFGLLPQGMTVFNGAVMFTAADAFNQNGLWVTDGTAAGTHELTGISGAGPSGIGPTDLTLFNGAVLFAGATASNKYTLWATDGTAAGTHEVTGISGANPNGVFSSVNIPGMTVFNGKVLLHGNSASFAQGLWVTDGTGAGTTELTGIAGASASGVFGSNQNPDFTVFGGMVLFDGLDASNHLGLWVTDGTAAGTTELTGISGANANGLFSNLSNLDSPHFTVLNGQVLFNGLDASGNNGLWVTDGTAAGTHELNVTGAYPLTPGLSPNYLTLFTPITPPPGPNPPPPAGTTATMVLRNGNGTYEIYDLGGNAILAGYQLARVGTDWGFVTLGSFNGADTADMLLRNSTTGGFQVYNVSNNNVVNSTLFANIGTDWQVMGFGNFSSRGETDMILRNVNTAGLEVYDIRNNEITGANFMGTVGVNWQFSGVGNFSSRGTSDMLLRNANTGALEVYDIDSNQITGAALIGTIGLDWQFSGVGNFSGVPGESDLLLRNVNTGGLEVYNINHNQLTGAALLGSVGLDWQFAGIAPVHAAGASDLVLRNVNTGAFQVYNITNNQITGSAALGSVGLDWQLGGFAPTASNGFAANSGGPLASGPQPAAGSTSQLVQAIAGFSGDGGAADGMNSTFSTDALQQQQFLTAPQHA
jgi:ELWxxDGT repeat protein